MAASDTEVKAQCVFLIYLGRRSLEIFQQWEVGFKLQKEENPCSWTSPPWEQLLQSAEVYDLTMWT